MTAKFDIRPLTLNDLPTVLEIERQVFPGPLSIGMFSLEIDKPDGGDLAALTDDRLVGYLICSRYDTGWHLMNIAVDPAVQRNGIARQLMLAMFARIDDPLARFTLEVRPNNAAAIKLYEPFGFRAVGIRYGYYRDTGEDALVMWLTPGVLRGSLDDVPNPDSQG